MKDAAQFAYMFDNSKSGGKMPKSKKKPVVAAKKPVVGTSKYLKPEPVKPAVKKVTSVGVTGSKGGRAAVGYGKSSLKYVAPKPTRRSMMGK